MVVADRPAPEPRLVKDGLGWRFSPAEAPVTITFSRIVERSSELTAEIHVQSVGEGDERHVLRRRVNLLGTNTPKTLASDLDSATDGAGWPWRRIVEQAFGCVIEAHRSGDEVRLLGGRKDPPPAPSHVIDGLMIKGVANTWFGPGGTGKSTAAVAACVAHKLGRPFAGIDVEIGTPLYLDWEDEDEAFERILWEVSRGYGLGESARVHWRRMKAPLASDIAYISALIDRIGATVVVIDSATRAMGSSSEHGTYESAAISFAEAIRALGKVTTLIIDHVDGATVKEGGVAKKAYGSIHKLNFVRNAWSLTLDDEASEQTVGWTNPKVNHGPKRPPFGIRYRRDQVYGGLQLERIAAMEVGVMAASMSARVRMIAMIKLYGIQTVAAMAIEICGSDTEASLRKIQRELQVDHGRDFHQYTDGTVGLSDRAVASHLRVVGGSGDEPDPLPF